MPVQSFNQGDPVCVQLSEARQRGVAAEASPGPDWQEGVVMAVMPDGQDRVGFYELGEEVVVPAERLRPRAEGERCTGT